MTTAPATETVLGISPFGEPDPRVVAAVCRAGGLGILDLGDGGRRAREALASVREWVPGPFGVRMAAGCTPSARDLLDGGAVHTVLLGAGAPLAPSTLAAAHRVLVEVTDRDEAAAAVGAGAHGLVARGNESGGRVGELSTFVLLQQLLADPDLAGVPVWACGGIGPRTAAASLLGGAAGVVLDTQLALLAEACPPEEVAAAVRTMDGSETVVVAGHRVLRRRGPDAPPYPEDPADVAALLGAEDPRTRLLPVGQDGFLAAHFAERWGDVGGAVRAVTDAVRDVVRDTARDRTPADALLPGSEMSRALGTSLPLAQGPMTRVSDQAGFAEAVAGHGGLPFLALALAGPDRTRALLEETRERLGERPWGVGVLGFAPDRIRSAQLEIVRELRPSCAIVAGGRPSQAASLEEAGVETYLHVPSPGLFRQFLGAGARKFVFEGSECGGHVGPRSSFALWEAQIAVLTDFLDTADRPDPAGFRVFFAGGVHDERSSAMVAALAAPLTARGVAVGLLMGTAYLFTEEAVGSGAVRPVFQRQVLQARRTELLETAPGHATRCVPSPYTENYRALKDELRGRGVPDREVWEQLERLNVGRLRIASKGVERVGEELALRDEDEQLAKGMFMAGDVAVLRSEVTTMDALHTAVTTGAAVFLSDRAAAVRERAGLGADEEQRGDEAPEPLDIAVVGMACMFPDAPDLDAYWANVVAGTDTVTEVPPGRWDPALYYAPGAGGDRTESKWGGFLPRIPFDPLRYGIPPSSLGSIEPVQLLSLEAARRALEDAGYGRREFDRSRASVVFGAEAGSDLSNAATLRTLLPAYLGELPPGLDAQLPRLTEDSFPGMLANVISGRIANRLDLRGANYTVDAACASSLAAVDVACKELSGGTSDLVLCGGADLHNGINDYLLFSSVHALSPTGRSRTFDRGADGIALGEGVACLVLKRLADADRDGDRVYAVIKGVGSSSDGRSRGLTAPRPEGQRSALERAYRNAGISPADVGMIEAHGTGTVVGDRTELGALTELFTESGAAPGSCALGSVKSQIGHTKCAAGLAGLIKAAMALHTGVTPPTGLLEEPNPAWQEGESPFVFHTTAQPWPAPPAERIAGVSAFGFGGTNFHVVLGAYDAGPPPAQGLGVWPAELFLFRGTDRADTARAIEHLLDLAEADAPHGRRWRLAELALTASRRADASAKPVRAAVVARDLDELPVLLRRALAGEHDPSAGVFLDEPDPGGGGAAFLDPTGADGGVAFLDRTGADGGDVAFLFPGQASQRPGMMAELFVAFPETQRYLHLGREWAGALYPPAAFGPGVADRQRARVTDTRVAQPALGMVGLAVHEMLGRAGVAPAMLAGHSYGELVALCAAGAFDPATLLTLSAERADAILSAAGSEPGTMAAVSAGGEDVARELAAAGLADDVVVANHNSPGQTVVSGPERAVAAAVDRLRESGFGARAIPVACAFHSPVVAGAGPRFAEVLAGHPVRTPEVPVWSNRTAAVHGVRPDEIRAELAAHIGAPVRFSEQIEAMYEAGARVFVEAGPGSVLTSLVSATLGDRPHTTVTCETPERRGLPGFLAALARLAVAGARVRTGWMFNGRDVFGAEAGASPEAPGWTVDGHLVRTRDGNPLPGSLAPAVRIQESAVTDHPSHDHGVPDRDRMVSEFLRTSREMMAAQRDVLLTYFGTTAGAAGAAGAAGPMPSPAATAPVPTAAPAAADPATSLPALGSPPADPPPPIGEAVPDGVPAATGEADVLGTVLDIISERTGYPVDMIEPDLDLEADLSIDSIKRIEIAGELASRVGAGPQGAAGERALGEDELEVLSKARTASGIADALTAKLGEPAAPQGESTPSSPPNPHADPRPAAPEPPGPGSAPTPVTAPPPADHDARAPAAETVPEAAAAPVTGTAPARFVLERVALPGPGAAESSHGSAEGPPALPAGLRFALLGDGTDPVVRALSAELADRGAESIVLGPGHVLTDQDGPVDGVFHLEAFARGEGPVLPEAFPVFRAALGLGTRWLIAAAPATAADDGRTDGLRGLFRTLAREYPDAIARTVVTGADETPPVVAAALADELLCSAAAPVVLRSGGVRHGLRTAERGLGPSASRGAGPGGDGTAEARAMGLDHDSVVLLVGGARGITARFAVALAAASRCRIELVGRTAESTGPEDPATARTVSDPAALRTALASARDGDRSPAAIERAVGHLLAQREIAATAGRLRDLGSPVRYHAADVRDTEAVHGLVKEIHAEYGRLDGVVHAAGVIEDRLVPEKDIESFRRVFGTKVDGARALLDAVENVPNGPRFAVLFGSIAAVLGNRGQVDYAAANDALESLGSRWARRGATPGARRALTVHWGPWAPSGEHSGMVTPELAREYARHGIGLIDPEEGVLALLRELAWGDGGDDAVLYTASGW
ncbi:SDR family oxidoreductase [Streptomyces sp. NPDC047108]|uniref:SDR family oxidoreductase n=1 Tax=Streptomyces sp. NPDC047108 TaxID=3155025 RepID=UPI0033F1B6D4